MQPIGNKKTILEGTKIYFYWKAKMPKLFSSFIFASDVYFSLSLVFPKLRFYTYGTTSNCIMKTTAMMNDKPDKPNIAASTNVGFSEWNMDD